MFKETKQRFQPQGRTTGIGTWYDIGPSFNNLSTARTYIKDPIRTTVPNYEYRIMFTEVKTKQKVIK